MLALTLLVLTQVDGGVAVPDAGLPPTFSDAIYETCPAAPPVVKLDGGWSLMPPERAQRIACLMETCDTDRMLRKERARAEANIPPWWWAVATGALGVGLTIGLAVGIPTGLALQPAPTSPSP